LIEEHVSNKKLLYLTLGVIDMNQILNSDDTDLSAAAKYSKDQIDQFIAEHNVKTIEKISHKRVRERMSSNKPQILLHRESLLTKLTFQIKRIRKRNNDPRIN
tara:strand:- start:42 stop:350 length:309 start_codon:yes stop_codon:yes gene_type:complete